MSLGADFFTARKCYIDVTKCLWRSIYGFKIYELDGFHSLDFQTRSNARPFSSLGMHNAIDLLPDYDDVLICVSIFVHRCGDLA